ncbi:MAG: GNAT family N-acetyltransferase [Chloroflexi bacterium]|nr:MAG: GNAT family N-acetyltransferase [Chloroflexota bacterium]
MSIRLPDHYTARPVSLDDLLPIVDLCQVYFRWMNGVNSSMEEELRTQWGFDFFNLATDTMAVFTADDLPVGYVEMWDVREPHVDLVGWAIVHPEHMGRGIGKFLADWLEERACQNIHKAPTGARVVLSQSTESGCQPVIDFLSNRGYRHVHNGYRMRIDFNEPPAEPVVPEGIVIRPIKNEEEERVALFAKYEAFLDHRGAIEEPFEEYYLRWKDIIRNTTYNDPSLWFVAWDGDQPAGMTLNYATTDDDPEMGWVHTVGVRRPWRRRGLGLALLQTAFCALYSRGKTRAGLGVDADSLTGATRLYERAGMYIERSYLGYELELRPGKILSRQGLESEE